MTPPRRRATTRATTHRAGSALEIDDGQLVEVADLGTMPRARVGVVDTGAELVAQARATIAELGHELVMSGTGKAGVTRLVAALRDDAGPDVVVVPLPGGEAAIDAARALAPRRPVLVAVIGGAAATAPARAHAAGADLATLRPHDAARLGPVLMAAATIAAERARLLIAQGTEAMLRQRLAGTTRQDTATGLPSFDDFRRIMELELKRARRYGYALSVCQLAINAGDPPAPGAIGNELRLRVAAAIGQAIRDIDFPVEIAGDRFLVLLPYTDAAGATAVARRILIALRDGKPVRGAGRTWLPDVAIGVAGIAAGAPVSMAELMRHAGEALRQARGRGVELVVA